MPDLKVYNDFKLYIHENMPGVLFYSQYFFAQIIFMISMFFSVVIVFSMSLMNGIQCFEYYIFMHSGTVGHLSFFQFLYIINSIALIYTFTGILENTCVHLYCIHT